MASPRSMKKGHIRKIHLGNFLDFEGTQTIEVSNDECPSLVGLIGSTDTGKTKLLECISHINILRHTYTVDKGQPFRLRRVNDGDTEEQADFISPKTFPEISCHIWKCQMDEEGYFVVEANGEESGHTVYYGLYSGKHEKEWYWDHKDDDGSYKYSTLFLLDTRKEQSLYVLSPMKHPQDCDLRHYVLNEAEQKDGFDALKPLLMKCLSGTSSECGRLTSLPGELLGLLPSELYSMKVTRAICGRLGVNFGDRHLMDTILLEVSDKTPCLLIENPMVGRTQHDAEKILDVIYECFEASDLQIVMTAGTESFSQSIRFTSVIRFWKSGPNKRQAEKVSREFLKKVKNPEKWFAFMTTNSVMLLEGQSDWNVMRGLMAALGTVADEDLLFILDNTFSYPVGGKGELQKYVGELLSCSLSILHFIVCDGDALVGGNADKFQKNKEKQGMGFVAHLQDKSAILKWKDSVLHQYIRHMLKHQPEKPAILRNIIDICTIIDGTLANMFAEGDQKGNIWEEKEEERLLKNIVKEHCDSYEHAKSFAIEHLRTISWEGGELERVVREKKATLTNPFAAGKIGRSVVKRAYSNDENAESNTDIFRLSDFLQKHVLPICKDVWTLQK